MSIAEIFESGDKKRKKGHFRNLVLIALADDIITEDEQALLTKMGGRLGLTNEQVEEIKANPEDYAINPPNTREDRVRRLVELVEMMNIDGKIDNDEMKMINRFAYAIGCNEKNIQSIITKTIDGMNNDLDAGEITDEILG